MAVKYRDYYEILGVKRSVGQDEIQRAYRKLARKYHPDVNKASNAEDKFKEINEAYEVLKDPEKRKMYDQLGSNWRAGQDFRPPPGWQARDFGQGGGGAYQTEFHWGGGGPGGGGFSDFFESLFGGMGFRQARGGAGPGGFGRGGVLRQAGADQETSIRISLEEAFHGGAKPIVLQSRTVSPQGQLEVKEKRYDVKIPAGILPDQKIRLSGQGEEGTGGGPRGDLYLKVEIEPHPVFRLNGRDITMDLPIAPWEAVLGTEVRVSALSGGIDLKIPPGTQGGRKLRLRGKGMPNPKGTAGDLYITIMVKVPTHPSKKELELFEELKKSSKFDPRA
ncbi:MAG: J domain-containing protein [Deltaproteobacteria bacterium]|jgi:curved DNA-binding protein|nr:J domain-containing protein [Deltaproteobacteria bacterium]